MKKTGATFRLQVSGRQNSTAPPALDLASMAFDVGKQVKKARDAGEDERLIDVMMGLQDVMFSMAGGTA